MSHLVNQAKIVSFTPPKFREYRVYIVETTPLKINRSSLKLSAIISKYVAHRRPGNVYLKVTTMSEELIDSKTVAPVLYPLLTYTIPYFIEEEVYGSNWIGLASVVDLRKSEPNIVGAGLVLKKRVRIVSRKPCIAVLIFLSNDASPDPDKLLQNHYRLVWNFLAAVLYPKLNQSVEALKLYIPQPRYVVLSAIVHRSQENFIEVRVPEAHASIKVRIPLRRPQWSLDDVPEPLRHDLEIAIVNPIKNRVSYAPRGMLIIGPPGVGKTVTAEAVASSLKLNIAELRPSIYRSMWYGMTEKALDRVLRTLFKRKNIVVLIDDADFLVGRHVSIHETHVSEISIFLQYLQQPRRPLVILTTNSPDLIDTALIRPGRIDVVIFMGYPDREMRRKVVIRCAQRYGLILKPDLVDFLVKITRWFTNAEIDALLRLAASKGGNELNEDSILWARAKFQINEGSRRALQEQLLWYSQRFQGIVLSYVPKESDI